MKYKDIILYLYNLRSSKGIDLTIERIKDALSAAGNPQEKFKTIHIAGTKGKGSISTMLASILKESDYDVGLYTSPHLTDFRERIQVNNRKILKKEVCEIFNECKDTIEKFDLTFFEAVTLMAFLYFEKKKIEIAVIEVGMGGRYDATNVINPILTIISNISLDHQEFLGNDEISIAKEKAGIIKNNVPLITCVYQPEILNLYRETCRQKNSELIHLNFFPKGIYKDLKFQEFVYKNRRYAIPLLGQHQIENAVCTIESIEKLKNRGIEISDKAIKNGLKNVKIEGRLEVFSRQLLIIIDVAHNKASFEALFNTMLKIKNGGNFKRIILILGILKYKNMEEIFKVVSKFSDMISVTILTKPNYELAAEPEDMNKFLNFKNVFSTGNVKDAIEMAMEINKTNMNKDCIVIAGSFFTAAEGKKYLKSFNLI
ncbi:MAG: hypothetical protein CVT88_00880 [Candidatus Altiarchaeales archaeon HGW-Altiarchaeales-1]|nr:MAG: hypothetical protein CVT88_00880 [Candidatus Altiarchaeales archaeon HGW-Altiarchaeales-1]